jgi:hypothetical protein
MTKIHPDIQVPRRDKKPGTEPHQTIGTALVITLDDLRDWRKVHPEKTVSQMMEAVERSLAD